MTSETGTGSDVGQTISLTIPVQDPKLFNFGATNDILILLTNNRYEEYTIREVAKYTDYAFDSVRKAVDTLLANDLLVESRDGNSRFIRINRKRLHVPDDPLLWIPQTEFHQPVRKATTRLRNEVNDIVGIVLYGSVARGEADRRSDIDLWALTDGDRAAGQRAANQIARELEEVIFDGQRYDYQIDVEGVQSIPRYTENIREIVGPGITVYETKTFQKVKALLRSEGMTDE